MEAKQRSAVLLDRNAMWLEALETILARAGVRVARKETRPLAALAAVSALRPDLLVTGLSMDDDGLDGAACVERALRQQPGLRTLVVSSCTDPADIDRALRAGAHAYVFKTAAPDDLGSAVRQVFDRTVFFSGTRFDAPQRTLQAVPAPSLTRREREILRLVAEGHSNAQLARMLWVTEQTVKFHLSNVYRKLDVANRTEAARWAQLHGLLGPAEATKLDVAA